MSKEFHKGYLVGVVATVMAAIIIKVIMELL